MIKRYIICIFYGMIGTGVAYTMEAELLSSHHTDSLSGSPTQFLNRQPREQRRGSLPPDIRKTLAAISLKGTGDSTPTNNSSDHTSPVDTPRSVETPPGISLNNFVDPISTLTVLKVTMLENGWQERKKRAFITSCLSRNAKMLPFEFGTLVYQVNEDKKLYRLIEFEANESLINENVVAVDARNDAIEELRNHLIRAVEKEAEDNKWQLEKSTGDNNI